MNGVADTAPLVTFALFTFNQERFIREALESVLAQTYQPLEIIVSDDASSDATFRIIEDMANQYTGPHKLMLNRNERNLGIGSHVNKVCGMVAGELIVVAAGDDVSLPVRTERLVDAWRKGGKKSASLCSDALCIDADGVAGKLLGGKPFSGNIQDGIANYFPGLLGATHAWRADVFRIFGEMLPDTVCEDRVIPLRSCFLGGTVYIAEPLVRYRIHGTNISHFSHTDVSQIAAQTIKIHRRNLNIHRNYCCDLATAFRLKLIDTGDYVKFSASAKREMTRISDKLAFMEGGHKRRATLIAKYLFLDPVQAMRWAVIHLMPSLYLRNQARNLGMSPSSGNASVRPAAKHGLPSKFPRFWKRR